MFFSRIFGSILLLRVTNVWCNNAMASTGNICHNKRIRYLTQSQATALDVELFNEYKFSVDQLMELAGLSVATAVSRAYSSNSHPSILVICGPGNNGGDGLVAARHLTLFGYNVSVYYPKRTPKPLYENLLDQCVRFNVDIIEKLPTLDCVEHDYNLIVDALFGFSFKPPIRAEVKPVLDLMIDVKLPVCSVDIPSGWDVEKGPTDPHSLKPAMLVSLSAPKICARTEFIEDAKHYLGGRFLPPQIIAKYDLNLPTYPDQDQVVKISC